MTIGNRLLEEIARISTPDRVLVYPKLIVVLFLVAWPINIFVLGQPPLDSQGAFIGNDFAGFYTGAKLWMNGQSQDLYNMKVQQTFQHSLVSQLSDSPIAQKQYKNCVPFINPPFSILLYLPFALAGYLGGLVLWWLFGLFCLGLSIKLMQKYFPGLRRWSNARLWGMTLVFFPTLAWFMYGQATTIILCIWTMCYVLLRLKREFWAGVVLSLLLFKPQLALGFAIPLIVSLRFRALLGGVLGLSCWGVLTYFVFPKEMLAYQQQYKFIIGLLRYDGYPSWGVHSLYGFSNLAIYPIAPNFSNLITGGFSIACILACIAIWWRTNWDPDSDEWNMRFAVGIPLCLLLAMQLFTYDLMLLLFPYFLIMGQKRYWNGPQNTYLDGGPVLAWTSLAYCACFLSGYFVKAQQIFFQLIQIPPLGLQLSVLCIIGWCWAVWRHPARSLERGPQKI